MSNYFLIAVSTRENLERCREHRMAGFPGSLPGFWAFVDIQVGDFVSFLYGARVYDLYRVVRKVAGEAPDPETESYPWTPLRFRSGRVYTFPFRLLLRRLRRLEEPIARPEFAYVAENLLLRGGYRKTHIQADALTLGFVSHLGAAEEDSWNDWDLPRGWRPFTPKIHLSERRSFRDVPKVWPFQELILQALIRHKLISLLDRLRQIYRLPSSLSLEVLGEKALPQGYVDLLIKPSQPQGRNLYIPVEVKTQKAAIRDVRQLEIYRNELGGESLAGILIAKDFTRAVTQMNGICRVRYALFADQEMLTFEEILQGLVLNWDCQAI